MQRNKQAFTLIELLVVVLIIGILAAVALPQYQKSVIRSRYATMKSIVEALARAEEVYYLANNSYGTINELDITLPEGATIKQTSRWYYPWGYCEVGSSVHCRNTDIKMGYQKNLSHHSSAYFAGKTTCIALSNEGNSILNRICKQETKSEDAAAKTDDHWTWIYQ